MNRVRALFLGASLRRAMMEAFITAAFILSILFGLRITEGGLDYRALAALFVSSGLGVVVLALRLRLPDGIYQQRTRFELQVATALAFGLGALGGASALVFMLLRADYGMSQRVFAIALFVVILALHSITYLGLRLGVRLWQWWNTVRRRRLLWALTHDQLVVVLVLMLVFGAIAAIASVSVTLMDNAITRNTTPQAVLYDQFFTLSILGSFYITLTAAILIGTLPLAILLSYLLVRRIVRRIETLTLATEALRRGEYTTRIAVTGEDEVALLQTDFNAMAADLDRTMHALEAERDRVAGLLQARRELIASVSHELRTPIATLRGYLDSTLQHADTLPSDVQSDMAVMERETVRLQTLVDDLFTLSRAEVGRLSLQMEPLDLATSVQRIVTTLAPLAWQSGRVEVIAQVEPDLPLATADEGRFEQVLRNLLHNAIRHTPPGGIVAVLVTAADDQVKVEVKDTGSGIAPEDLPRVWERFYRAGTTRTPDHGGAGLGLALVKELTEAMGGHVTVESTLGSGSTFTLHLAQSPALPLPVDLRTPDIQSSSQKSVVRSR